MPAAKIHVSLGYQLQKLCLHRWNETSASDCPPLLPARYYFWKWSLTTWWILHLVGWGHHSPLSLVPARIYQQEQAAFWVPAWFCLGIFVLHAMQAMVIDTENIFYSILSLKLNWLKRYAQPQSETGLPLYKWHFGVRISNNSWIASSLQLASQIYAKFPCIKPLVCLATL